MSARDELYAYATVAFRDGVPPLVHQHVTRLLDALEQANRAKALADGADALETEAKATDVHVAAYPRYGAGQQWALSCGASLLRRLAAAPTTPTTKES